MVWAGIMLDDRTPLHVFERGSVTGVRYRDEVLEPCVCLFQRSMSPDFNPIEYVWDALGRAIATRTSPPSSENHPGNENMVAERV
ncbi:DDE_3 domain-containing protein [Trichonephila clavipes]|nr:DDE_3 domain-containing protein [Trichonephila clavipes]